ncbi:transcription elongation factor GreA [Candidatus Peregrinibacteria bacterium]|nr:transcription elongation factor GreA [Candidatus Peregrinibacteria bacterium]
MTDEQNSTQQPAAGNNEEKTTLLTKEGLQKLKEELDHLKNVKRKEVVERIKEAITYGDLSENAEYEDAKNDQAFTEGRILELEEKIKYAKIIDEKHKSAARIRLGSTVTLKRLGKKTHDPETYVIVGSTEADALNGRISNESPVGKVLLDKTEGETIKIQAPAGATEYKIVKVK